MKELLERSGGVILIGCMGGLGITVRMILFVYYASLSKACKRFEVTKNKTIGYIREDLKRYEQRNQSIKSAMLYTECRLAEQKVLGIRVGSLENFWQQSLLLVPLSGVLSALLSLLSGGAVREMLSVLFISCGVTFGLLLADLVIGMREKQKRIRLYIKNYIDNERENLMQEEVERNELSAVLPAREDRKKKAGKLLVEKGKRKSKRQERNGITSTQKKGKAQEEKRRLTEELLRERRQLEARSFAEQRRIEREAEIQIQADRVQEEAAATATEASYETLLSEVLAEYLV